MQQLMDTQSCPGPAVVQPQQCDRDCICEDCMGPILSSLTDEYEGVLGEMRKLHSDKQSDYAVPQDPFSNIRQSEDFGIPGWLGAVIRANDKVSRLKTFARTGDLKCESVEDSLLDAANYFLIGLVLYRQSMKTTGRSSR